jgi:tRNA (cmo5U34)-methyltransferase
MSTNPPHDEHDWHSAEYVAEWISTDRTRDALRRPKLRRAASLLPFERAAPITVLDIGGGYGEFSRQVLEEFPRSDVVLLDSSEPMLDAARERLAPFGERIRFHVADLASAGWTGGLDGPFDAAVSSIAIHNLRVPSLIHAVYRETASVVAQGGAFFNLDYLFPRSPALGDLYARASRRPPGARGTRSDRDEEPATLERQLSWLAESFDEADCLWKDLREALLCGLRA